MTEMQAKNIKIGDTVICNASFKNYPQKNWKGKVVAIHKTISSFEGVGIEWENGFSYGHDCSGNGKDHHCRFYYPKQILDDDNILILDLFSNQLEFDF